MNGYSCKSCLHSFTQFGECLLVEMFISSVSENMFLSEKMHLDVVHVVLHFKFKAAFNKSKINTIKEPLQIEHSKRKPIEILSITTIIN